MPRTTPHQRRPSSPNAAESPPTAPFLPRLSRCRAAFNAGSRPMATNDALPSPAARMRLPHQRQRRPSSPTCYMLRAAEIPRGSPTNGALPSPGCRGAARPSTPDLAPWPPTTPFLPRLPRCDHCRSPRRWCRCTYDLLLPPPRLSMRTPPTCSTWHRRLHISHLPHGVSTSSLAEHPLVLGHERRRAELPFVRFVARWKRCGGARQ
ncbi:putative uncharacterized protein ENSP00000383309 [Zea mays]|uniref:Uncharacterized protein n=1 Tax=Zea mays TaxID=4577 RepID=C0PDU4_MAIZE|nr:putative uncharacterized protein ENSP00000383309 [Zea mays]XP_023158111.1 putative uncharacterized protein ENSP00000383309 [Zea mays]XP_035823152.1 putative uncharacterized protein ENSP00000383309 [Zea mays]XP_035823153.1 putative uncharacterized protein ENSP00000383309 [Zea mays]XP_035823154.1 putative uncharacterized protein ENSP00000383309 [Zea mays]XP_035823155.1 putative uncharacterized protein ENSP00000383309 [Zea mays]XP_035823156.1 putative uncharacterized protein ENSP00000383309 [|eukprot:NP_001169312.1 uncharacterized protein LOC100383176 [Zea mays]